MRAERLSNMLGKMPGWWMLRLKQHKSVVSLAFKSEHLGFIEDWKTVLMIQFFFFILISDRDINSGRIPMLILTVQHISRVLNNKPVLSLIRTRGCVRTKFWCYYVDVVMMISNSGGYHHRREGVGQYRLN